MLLKDAHVAYISWERLEANQQQLRENSRGPWPPTAGEAPRGRGPALLQGLALCGVCGSRMTVRYNVRKQVQVPTYLCQRDLTSTGGPICQRIPGTGIDAAIGALLVDLVTPATLEVALGCAGRAQGAGQRSQDVACPEGCSGHGRRSTSRVCATWVPIPTTAWSSMCWKQNGTPGCAPSMTHSRSSTARAPKTTGSSQTRNAGRSLRWQPTSPVYGAIQRHRIANAREWRGC